MEIVNILYDLARTHKAVRGFIYNKGYAKGAGTDMYPLVWVDDPVLGNSNEQGNAMRYTVNVDFLDLPKVTADVPIIQQAMQLVGLAFRERLKGRYKGAGVDSLNFVTLREYYDDDAAGVRFTFGITLANPVNLCEEYFDDDKTIVRPADLPDFSVENPNGCAIFSNKNGLPNFKL